MDKAREIALRALRTISFREEKEKMNVWVARLNLENSYGSQKSLDEVFAEACQSMDSREVHFKLATIYESSGKFDKANATFQVSPLLRGGCRSACGEREGEKSTHTHTHHETTRLACAQVAVFVPTDHVPQVP